MVLVAGTNSSLVDLYGQSTRTFVPAAQMPGVFPAIPWRPFSMPNGAVMAAEGPSSLFDFYHP